MKPATSNMRFEGGIFLRLFDMHCDTLYECFQKRDGLKENRHHVDLRRGLRFDAWAQVFAVWLPDTLGEKQPWIPAAPCWTTATGRLRPTPTRCA